MSKYAQFNQQLKTPEVMKQLNYLYGQREGMLVSQSMRYRDLLKKHEEIVGRTDDVMYMISAPGRTEIGGNHTDHNRGKVLAAAVNLDTLAAVTKRSDGVVNVFSEGYAPLSVKLDDLDVHEEEKGTTAALVRGVASKMKAEGFEIGGFDAVITSTVRGGSGLSSSAAVEVLLCAIFDELYNGNRLEAKKRAQISQYVENVFFGKPSGLLDQMASSVGGFAYIDFKEDDPEVEAVHFDFAAMGYALVVVNTGGSHDDLTDFYASIPQEMHAVAEWFGEKTLRPVLPERFARALPQLRKELGIAHTDRAILRAAHFFEENRRVGDQVSALKRNDLQDFFRLIIESGRSSYCYLQNTFAHTENQEIPLALMMAESMLSGDGAWRVHGGGFAGTTLNFVPLKKLDGFVRDMEAVFGARSCNVLDIRPVGPACIKLGQ